MTPGILPTGAGITDIGAGTVLTGIITGTIIGGTIRIGEVAQVGEDLPDRYDRELRYGQTVM